MGANGIARHWDQACEKAGQLRWAAEDRDVLALIYALVAADHGRPVDEVSLWEVRYQLLDLPRLRDRLSALLPGPDGFGPATVEDGQSERLQAFRETSGEDLGDDGRFTGPAPLEGRLWRMWAALQAPHGTLYEDTLTSEELDVYDRMSGDRGYVPSGKSVFEHATGRLARLLDKQVFLPASGAPDLGAPVLVTAGMHQGRSGRVQSVLWAVEEDRRACAAPPVSFSVRLDDRGADVVDVASGDLEALPEWDGHFAVAYAGRPMPTSWAACVLVFGTGVDSEWHRQVLSALREEWAQAGQRLVVLVAQHDDGASAAEHPGWLRDAWAWADQIIVDCSPGFALPPRCELPDGVVTGSAGRLILHAVDPETEVVAWSARHAVPLAPSPRAAASAALSRLLPPRRRTGGERQVPLHVRRNTGFAYWADALWATRDVIDGATVNWTTAHREFPQNADWWSVQVRIRHPDQSLTTETVTGRTCRIGLVLWVRRPKWTDSEVLLLCDRASRAASRSTFFVTSPCHLPGFDLIPQTATDDHRAGQWTVQAVAADLGVRVNEARMRMLGNRMESALLASPLNAVAVELSEQEYNALKARHRADATDRYEVPEFHRVAELLATAGSPVCGWATLGVIVRAVAPT